MVASAWSVGLVAISREISSPGMLLLLSASTAGIMSTGALVCAVVPLVSLAWLVVLLVGCYFIVTGLGFDLQLVTLGLLLLYAVVLQGAVLFISRLFVKRVEAEVATESERQNVGLLLGDFEEKATDWLWESDNDGVLTRVSARLVEALGRDASSVIQRPLSSLFLSQRVISVPSDDEVGVEALQDRMKGSVAFSNLVVEASAKGIQRSWKLSAKPLLSPNGVQVGWRGVGSEVSDARAREAEGISRERHLHHLATHDVLTDLPNRRAFLEALARMLECAGQAPTTSNAMALVDLDNFKAVNDTLGHSAGDAVLKRVAARLQRALHPGDFLARLGGDEFAILMEGLPSADPLPEIQSRAHRILEHLRSPETIEEFRIDVRASVGITEALSAPESPYELMRRADVALYVAKDSGRDNFKVYEAAMSTRMEHRLSTVSDLAGALERGELEVVYQCVVELDSMKIVGCEALVRWHHPRYGLISPSEFIPAAEESGLIIPIGLWVLQQACQDAMQWPHGIGVAVNVSAVQVGSQSIVESIVDTVRDSGIVPGRVELEITESAISRDDQVARDVLQRLREHGFPLAIDDFGTGYSSMAQLRELPFDTLKLDRSFVASLGGERGSASNAIIASLLHLSRSMHMSVIAEGLETRDELEALRELGCQYGQGYLFAMPLPQRLLLRTLQSGYIEQG
jgi:diguanylate cyclase (GGDEF)-like protein